MIEYREAWAQLHNGRVGVSGTRNQVFARAPMILAYDDERDLAWNAERIVWAEVKIRKPPVLVAQFTFWDQAEGGRLCGAGPFFVAKHVWPGDTISIARGALVVGGAPEDL